MPNPINSRGAQSESGGAYLERVHQAELAKLDQAVEKLKAPLFNLADKAVEVHQNTPFTSLLIDDCAARYCGLFLSKTLRALSHHKLDTFGVKPYLSKRELPLRRLGQHTLLVTEYIASGQHINKILEGYCDQSINFRIATCSISGLASIQQITDTRIKEVWVGSLDFDERFLRSNGYLNGIASRSPRGQEEVVPFAAVYGPSNSIIYYEKLHQAKIQHSRETLNALVAQYVASRK